MNSPRCPKCGQEVFGFLSVVAKQGGGTASTTQYHCGACKRMVVPVWKVLLILLALALGPAEAQTLDVTHAFGRVYNITTGEWTVASVPGVEFGVPARGFGGFTFSVSWWLDLSRNPETPAWGTGTMTIDRTNAPRFFEHDWSLMWSKEWTDRLETSVTAAIYVFRELGTDRIWLVETRYHVLGRN